MIYDLMLKRRSIRKFKPTMPDRELLEQVVAAAITAPSASNKQPWKFLIVTDQKLIKKATTLVQKEVEEIVPLLDPPFQEGFSRYSENFTIFNRAPVLMVPLYRTHQLLSQMLPPDARTRLEAAAQLELKSALISVSCAIQNMLLKAAEAGLGSCCMTGPLIAADDLKVLFNIPESWDISCLIPMGFPDETPEMPERKSINSTIKWISGE